MNPCTYWDRVNLHTRSNSKVKSTNCHARNMSLLRQQTNLKRWKRSVSYGCRWMAETVFSSIKRTFGEHVTARKFPYMDSEIYSKCQNISMLVIISQMRKLVDRLKRTPHCRD